MFGSEFMSMRIRIDLSVALCYKLRMFSVPSDGPSNVLYDTQGFDINMSLPQSILGKKHNALNYHFVKEGAESGIL